MRTAQPNIYSEENLKSYRKNILRDTSFEGLYMSEEAVQSDIDSYKAWLLKDGDEIIGERQNLILQPQASFVLMDQHTGRSRHSAAAAARRRPALP